MMARRRGPGFLFHLAAGAATLFVLTVLAMIAGLAEPAAPLNRWLNRHGIALIVAEVGLIAVSACAAMWRDQQTTLQDEREEKPHT